MPKRGRPFEYQTDEDRPVTVSLRIPKDLYNRMETYRRMHQQSITELLLDGLRMRLDTPADPRDLLMSDDNTVIQELEEMVDARVQAALARMGGAMLPHSLAASPLAESYVQQASHIAEPVPQAHTPDVPGDRVPSTKAGLVEDFPGHDIPESVIPPYDETKYVLGKLCPRGHEYHGSGRTLRTIKGSRCMPCENESKREKRAARGSA